MTRKVGIPGCGLPQEKSILKNKPKSNPHEIIVNDPNEIKHRSNPHEITVNDPNENGQFSYSFNKYGIPHDTTNIYSSSSATEQDVSKNRDHFVPGGVHSTVEAGSKQPDGSSSIIGRVTRHEQTNTASDGTAIPMGEKIHHKQTSAASDGTAIPKGENTHHKQTNVNLGGTAIPMGEKIHHKQTSTASNAAAVPKGENTHRKQTSTASNAAAIPKGENTHHKQSNIASNAAAIPKGENTHHKQSNIASNAAAIPKGENTHHKQSNIASGGGAVLEGTTHHRQSNIASGDAAVPFRETVHRNIATGGTAIPTGTTHHTQGNTALGGAAIPKGETTHHKQSNIALGGAAIPTGTTHHTQGNTALGGAAIPKGENIHHKQTSTASDGATIPFGETVHRSIATGGAAIPKGETTHHKQANIASDAAGLGTSFLSPKEAGYDKNKISTSSAREINPDVAKTAKNVNPNMAKTVTHSNPDKEQSARGNSKSTQNVAYQKQGRSDLNSKVNGSIWFTPPHEMGFDNKQISVSSQREISSKMKNIVNASSIPVPSAVLPQEADQKKSTAIKEGNETPLKNVNTSSVGTGKSIVAPWEMGFNNKSISTATAREISQKTNISTQDIAKSFTSIESPTTETFYDASSFTPVPRATPTSKELSNTNIISSTNGAGFSLSAAPWEMGFDNRTLSASSSRELSDKTNKTVCEVSSKSVVSSSSTSRDPLFSQQDKPSSRSTQNVSSAGIGAQFSSKSPWEMGFGNIPMSTSSTREISASSNKTTSDISQGSKGNNKLKPDDFGITSSKKTLPSNIGPTVVSSGTGAQFSLNSPWEMGFDNQKLSSSSAREILPNVNKSVADLPNSSTLAPTLPRTIGKESGKTSSHPKHKENISIGYAGGMSLSSPHEMGFDNKQLSSSSIREISSKTNRPIQSSATLSPTHIGKKSNVAPVANGKESNFITRHTVGYDVAFQGLSINQLPPPLGIKGMFKRFNELNTSPTRVSNSKGYNSELQEPLESAFMPEAEKRRDLKDKESLQADSSKLTGTTVGEYNILAKDLEDPRMSANVFGSGLQRDRDITGKDHNISPLETNFPQELDRDAVNKESFKSKGRLVALDSLEAKSAKTLDSTISNEGEFVATKPIRDELVPLDSIVDKNEKNAAVSSDIDSTYQTKSSVSPKSPTQSSSYENQSSQTEDYWKRSRKHSHAKILKGSRRPATEDQIVGKSVEYVEMNDPRVRRRSIGSTSYSQEVGNYPSLIDPNVPTYGFNQKQNDLTPLASNEYYISDPFSQTSKKGSALPLAAPSSYVYQGKQTVYTETPRLDRLESEEPNDATIRSMKDVTPQSYNENWEGKREDEVPRQPERRKSRASIVLGKFAKAVTKSTI
ncbi:hypothetical protein MOSE0_G00562 [Monosporozyma servazzii]